MKIRKNSSTDTFIEYEDNLSGIVSGANSVYTTKEAGVFINGPLSIKAGLEDIRIGGIFKINPLNALGLPSSSLTPIPLFNIDLPVGNTKSISSIASTLRGI